jgi:uncharacterized protein YcgL (UPF0745 family)
MENISFEPAHDVLPLPSGGKFYKTKKSALKVAYLTASDENVLTSPNLLQNGKVLDVLLERKILDKDIKVSQLLSGDKNAVLFFLRATGYGEMYPVEITDPKTGEKFETEIDISQFQAKAINVEPDENGECDFVLPKSKKRIKFRYLTSEEDEKIIKEDEARRNKFGKDAVSQILTMRLTNQIMEVEGVRDKLEISRFVDQMPVLDSNALRKFIEENEPGLDTNISIQAPSGEFFFGELPITAKFLWPFLES